MASDPKFKMGDRAVHIGESVSIVSDSIWEPASETRHYVVANDDGELELIDESALKIWEPTHLLVQVPESILRDWDDFSDTVILDEYLLPAIRAWKKENESA